MTNLIKNVIILSMYRRNSDKRLRRLERTYRQTGLGYEEYASAIARAGILEKLYTRAQVSRMRNLLAMAPLAWRSVDDELQRMGWVEIWDEGWETYETKPSAAPTELANEHFYQRNGQFNPIWCQHQWEERTGWDIMQDSYGESYRHYETWTECSVCHTYR
jgi:hypothetical protein